MNMRKRKQIENEEGGSQDGALGHTRQDGRTISDGNQPEGCR